MVRAWLPIVLACACGRDAPSLPPPCTPASGEVQGTELFVADVLYTPPDGCVAPADLGAITSEGEFRSAYRCDTPSGVDFRQRHLYVVVVADGELPVWTAREAGVLHAGIASACGAPLRGVTFLTEVDEAVRVHPCACADP